MNCTNPQCGMRGYMLNGEFRHFVNGSAICPPRWVNQLGAQA